jgi:hypothetical protein
VVNKTLATSLLTVIGVLFKIGLIGAFVEAGTVGRGGVEVCG